MKSSRTQQIRGRRITVNLSAGELARFEELRPVGVSDSGYFRILLQEAGPAEPPPTRAEALTLLARSARAGRVVAQTTLIRELSREQDSTLTGLDELDRILGA